MELGGWERDWDREEPIVSGRLGLRRNRPSGVVHNYGSLDTERFLGLSLRSSWQQVTYLVFMAPRLGSAK